MGVATSSSAMRTLPVRLALSTSWRDQPHAARNRIGDAGQTQARRHADGEAGEGLFRSVRLEIDRAVDDDAEERLAGARRGRAEPGGPAADEA